MVKIKKYMSLNKVLSYQDVSFETMIFVSLWQIVTHGLNLLEVAVRCSLPHISEYINPVLVYVEWFGVILFQLNAQEPEMRAVGVRGHWRGSIIHFLPHNHWHKQQPGLPSTYSNSTLWWQDAVFIWRIEAYVNPW